MRAVISGRRFLAGLMALAPLVGLPAGASAAPVTSTGPDGASSSSLASMASERPSPHFGFSQGSVLAQITPPIIIPLPPPLPPPPPPLLPPPLLPPPGPMGALAPPPRAAMPEVPVIPEADSLWLLVGGLVALGGLVGYRRRRRFHD